MVDRDLILRKLSYLDTYRGQLEEFRTITIRQYRDDWKTQRIVERTLQMMIETCLDIANHIVSDRGFRVPVSYGDVFRVLGEHRILKPGLAGRLEKMAAFRNLLVHQYERLDPEIVVGLLKKNMGDFTGFKNAVIDYIKKYRQVAANKSKTRVFHRKDA